MILDQSIKCFDPSALNLCIQKFGKFIEYSLQLIERVGTLVKNGLRVIKRSFATK